jgi:hypothetical protein
MGDEPVLSAQSEIHPAYRHANVRIHALERGAIKRGVDLDAYNAGRVKRQPVFFCATPLG